MHVGKNNKHYHITLHLHYEGYLGADQPDVAIQVVGLTLWFVGVFTSSTGSGEELQRFAPDVIRTFYSVLPAFPHLEAVELRAPLRMLRGALQTSPEMSLLPNVGPQVVYRWACPRADFETLPAEYSKYEHIGVDPETLEPSGKSTRLM